MADIQHRAIVKDLKQDLGLAAQAGMQLMKQTQESEDNFKSEIDELAAENSRLLRINSQLISESNARNQQQIDASAKATQLESALAIAQARAAQLNSYFTVAKALEEQVTALETLRAELEAERDEARSDSMAFEARWRASEKFASQIQASYDALESSLPGYKLTASAMSTAPPTPRESRYPRHGIMTPDATPDTSFTFVEGPAAVTNEATTSTTTTLEKELAAFDLKPKLKRATSHDSIFSPPSLAAPKPSFAVPQFNTRSSIATTAATERIVVSGVRAGPGRGAARAFLGNVRR